MQWLNLDFKATSVKPKTKTAAFLSNIQTTAAGTLEEKIFGFYDNQINLNQVSASEKGSVNLLKNTKARLYLLM